MKGYRHELKYIATAGQLAVVAARLGTLMQSDPHAGEDGGYTIRSLYFDDVYDSCFMENQNGTDLREKFRLRLYNGSTAHIRLELKQKRHGMTKKQACPLSAAQCQSLMEGTPPPLDARLPPLVQKLSAAMRTRGMRPVVVVEYHRRPLVYPLGNVRVTLDEHLTACGAPGSFLQAVPAPRRAVMPTGQQLLEVKFDTLLPDAIKHCLETGELRQATFSKFYLCRKLTMEETQ